MYKTCGSLWNILLARCVNCNFYYVDQKWNMFLTTLIYAANIVLQSSHKAFLILFWDW